jgi:hypothetical protein
VVGLTVQLHDIADVGGANRGVIWLVSWNCAEMRIWEDE